jgi:hypothetical protein
LFVATKVEDCGIHMDGSQDTRSAHAYDVMHDERFNAAAVLTLREVPLR